MKKINSVQIINKIYSSNPFSGSSILVYVVCLREEEGTPCLYVQPQLKQVDNLKTVWKEISAHFLWRAASLLLYSLFTQISLSYNILNNVHDELVSSNIIRAKRERGENNGSSNLPFFRFSQQFHSASDFPDSFPCYSTQFP